MLTHLKITAALDHPVDKVVIFDITSLIQWILWIIVHKGGWCGLLYSTFQGNKRSGSKYWCMAIKYFHALSNNYIADNVKWGFLSFSRPTKCVTLIFLILSSGLNSGLWKVKAWLITRNTPSSFTGSCASVTYIEVRELLFSSPLPLFCLAPSLGGSQS